MQPSWTGFYVFGGGGGGIWDAESNVVSNPGNIAASSDQRLGGDGWFGTVGAGYDWQFNGPWVAGVFADGQFGSMSGSLADSVFLFEGREKLRDSWAARVRLGYLVAPSVLSYVNGGYTGSEWSGANLSPIFVPASNPNPVISTPSFSRNGWFVGGGVENSLNIFGISAPGLFMKTEYRASYFDRVTLPETITTASFAPFNTLGPTGFSDTFKPWVQTVSTSLVYRFNWTGAPVAAKY